MLLLKLDNINKRATRTQKRGKKTVRRQAEEGDTQKTLRRQAAQPSVKKKTGEHRPYKQVHASHRLPLQQAKSTHAVRRSNHLSYGFFDVFFHQKINLFSMVFSPKFINDTHKPHRLIPY
jgi:hypothetical protein